MSLALRVTHVRALLGLARPEEALRLADAEVALHARRGAAGHEAMARLSRALVLGGDEASLTPWERRVADLAADGLANKEIAEALFVTLKTVEVHFGCAYSKLDIKGRSQLPAALAAG